VAGFVEGDAVPTARDRRVATAYHEAGHTVVRYFQRFRIRQLEVSIVANAAEGSHGHSAAAKPRVRRIEVDESLVPHSVLREIDPETDEPELVERLGRPWVTSLLSGMIAEQRFTGRYNRTGARSDRAEAREFVGFMSGSKEEQQAWMDRLWSEAERAVETRWTFIEALAQELLVRRTMTGPEVVTFLQAQQALSPAKRNARGRSH
jgi:hypothetical protein